MEAANVRDVWSRRMYTDKLGPRSTKRTPATWFEARARVFFLAERGGGVVAGGVLVV